MIPSLIWADNIKIWTDKREQGSSVYSLGPPSQVLGPRFDVGAIEKSKIKQEDRTVANGEDTT